MSTSFWDATPDLSPPAPQALHDDAPSPTPNGHDDGYWASVVAQAAAEIEVGPEEPPPTSAIWTVTQPWNSADIPLRPWVARGYLMRGAVTVLSGPGSAGKSSLMLAWAACGTTGAAFRQFRVPSETRFAVYNVEDDANEQKRRLSAMFRRLGLSPEAFGDRLALLGPSGIGALLTLGARGDAMVDTATMGAIEEFFLEFRPDVAFFDPFVELHDADENDNTAVRAVMAYFRRLAVRFNCAVLVAHHARKGAGDPGDPDSLRGASAIVGAARVVLTLNVMTREEAKSFNIPEDRRRSYFRLDGAKSNYAPIEDAEWFERHEIRLDNGTDSEPGDGVAVVWPWKPPSVWAETTPDTLNRVLDILSEPPAGWLYTASAAGRDNRRWAGHVLTSELRCTPEQAKRMIKSWLESGLLFVTDYEDERRKKVSGVRVNHSKRPT